MKSFKILGDTPADAIARNIASAMMNRRRLLQVAGAGATAAVVAACGVGGNSDTEADSS